MLPSLLVLALGPLAHAESPADHVDAPEADPAWGKIVNGRKVTGDAFPAAAALMLELPEQFGGLQSSCTMSLITPRLLLTAAHCTAEYGLPESALLRIASAYFANDVSSDSAVEVAFADIRTHPDYVFDDTPTPGEPQIQNDVSVIELAEDVTHVAPVWFRTTPVDADDALGLDVTSVGFGVVSAARSDQGTNGIKRVAELVVGDVDDQFLYAYARDNPDHANVCSGDSGGPQYTKVGGEWEQWGIHSFVFSLTGGDPCLNASGSTNVGSFAPWILKQVERVHGTTDRCEINGQYLDRTCDDFCDEPDPDCIVDINGDGVVSDDELDDYDADGDGNISDEELVAGPVSGLVGCDGCAQSGTGPVWLALPLLGLALRRRR